MAIAWTKKQPTSPKKDYAESEDGEDDHRPSIRKETDPHFTSHVEALITAATIAAPLESIWNQLPGQALHF
jgi:hypothetical protein